MRGELFIPLLAIAGFWAAVISFIVYYYKTRHIQRMALIENNKDASIFQGAIEEISKVSKNNSLKYGLLLTGLGMGLIVGVIIDDLFDFEPAGTFASMLIFGGMSLIINHFLENKNDSHQGSDMV